MEYIYAAMLLHKAGQEVNEANVKKVLDAAGVKTDDARVKALIAALEAESGQRQVIWRQAEFVLKWCYLLELATWFAKEAKTAPLIGNVSP